MKAFWSAFCVALLATGIVFAGGSIASAQAVKMAVIEPLSGPLAGTGKPWVDHFLVSVDDLNARGGVLGGRKLEVTVLDNAGNVEKTNELLRRAYDDGIRYVVMGIGSNLVLAANSFIDRQNKRNPDSPMLLFNTSGGAMALTNDQCTFWHYRWGIGADMSAAALVKAIAQDPSVKRIYQMDQAYALGQSFNEEAAKLLKEKLPNVVVVGSDLIQPFGRVQDFTPYVLKLKQNDVDTVLSSAFDVDLVRFYKAVAAAGLKVKFYTVYSTTPPHMSTFTPQETAAVPLFAINDYNPDENTPADILRVHDAYKKKSGSTYFAERHIWMLDMFKAALEKAGSDNPLKVARALEDVVTQTPSGTVHIRKDDHQFAFPLTIVQITGEAKNKYYVEGNTTGIGMKTVRVLSPSYSLMPTTCKMQRP